MRVRRLSVLLASSSSREGRLLLRISSYQLRALALAGVCVLSGLLVTSCIPNPFNQSPEPKISILAGSPHGPAPLDLTFDISASNDPDGEIVSFTFDFADGTPPVSGNDLSQPLPHIYTEPGQFFASLMVEDDDGKLAMVMFVITIDEPAE